MCDGERGVCSKHRQVADGGTVPALAPDQQEFCCVGTEIRPDALDALVLKYRLMSLICGHTGDWLERTAACFADPNHWVDDFAGCIEVDGSNDANPSSC